MSTKIRRQRRERLIDTLDVMDRFRSARVRGLYCGGGLDRFLRSGEKMREGMQRAGREFMALLARGVTK